MYLQSVSLVVYYVILVEKPIKVREQNNEQRGIQVMKLHVSLILTHQIKQYQNLYYNYLYHRLKPRTINIII